MSASGDIPDAFLGEVRAYAARRWPTHPDAPRWILQLMMSESGLYTTAENSIGCGGLIGFCGRDDWRGLDFVGQLRLAESFWNDPRLDYIQSAANLYQYNFVPASLARGVAPGVVIVAKGGTGYGGNEGAFYDENTGLDMNHDGKITVADMQARLDSPAVSKAPRYLDAVSRLYALPRPGGFSTGALLALAALSGAALAVTAYETHAGEELDGARELRDYTKRALSRAFSLLR